MPPPERLTRQATTAATTKKTQSQASNERNCSIRFARCSLSDTALCSANSVAIKQLQSGYTDKDRKKPRLSVTVPRYVYQALLRWCETTGENQSDIVEQALQEFLSRKFLEKKPEPFDETEETE